MLAQAQATHAFHLAPNILWGFGGRSAPNARAGWLQARGEMRGLRVSAQFENRPPGLAGDRPFHPANAHIQPIDSEPSENLSTVDTSPSHRHLLPKDGQ